VTLRVVCLVSGLLSLGLSLAAQTADLRPVSASVPPLIQFSSVATDEGGSSMSGLVNITFSLYGSQKGGEPLWTEKQNSVPLDATGHYSVQLGVASAKGVPTTLFTTGEARWLGVRIAEQAEQPRVLLLSVPYALKAGDAATIGGLPPSAFVLAAPGTGDASAQTNSTESTASVADVPPAGSVTGSGTANFVPLWTSASSIGNSVLFQSGTGSTAKVGINTITPASTLDIKGTATIRGLFSLPSAGTATSTKGTNSQAEKMTASVFNSGTGTAVPQNFQWQAEPVRNNTSGATGSLNLLFAQGSSKPAETGLNIASNGKIKFAAGQTFPGAGTITGVTAGIDLTGGGTSGDVTLNVDTAKVPQLSGNNSFTGNETISGSVTAASFSGNGAGVTNVNAKQFGGLAPAAYAQLAAFDAFTVGLSVTSASNTDGLDVDATGTGNGIFSLAASGVAVEGIVLANSGTTPGVFGVTVSAGSPGVAGSGGTGVMGTSSSCCLGSGGKFVGFLATAGSGVITGTDGVDATGGNGDPSTNSLGNNGVVGTGGNGAGVGTDGVGGLFQGGSGGGFGGGDGIEAIAGSADAGNFSGDVFVSGAIFAGTKDFKIDHPLDPANKYLLHASVESSEMMNIYTGNVTTDAQGEATVQLPDWFEVLNTDFRYQLTVIGQFAQAIIARKIESNRFQIRTSVPNVEVSWQVTGVRHDAFAKAHPLVVEEQKNSRLQGFYIHPELYGAPAEKQIEWGRHPEIMKKMKEKRQVTLPLPGSIVERLQASQVSKNQLRH
jgi:trimeric autotransporter adhesin